ncbi:hypothetical protein K2D_25140 [Planctomycetes bacterium K2D]|nr:hypothetical protein K2D_25140 [Planctomycetes bacterium K2D]
MSTIRFEGREGWKLTSPSPDKAKASTDFISKLPVLKRARLVLATAETPAGLASLALEPSPGLVRSATSQLVQVAESFYRCIDAESSSSFIEQFERLRSLLPSTQLCVSALLATYAAASRHLSGTLESHLLARPSSSAHAAAIDLAVGFSNAVWWVASPDTVASEWEGASVVYCLEDLSRNWRSVKQVIGLVRDGGSSEDLLSDLTQLQVCLLQERDVAIASLSSIQIRPSNEPADGPTSPGRWRYQGVMYPLEGPPMGETSWLVAAAAWTAPERSIGIEDLAEAMGDHAKAIDTANLATWCSRGSKWFAMHEIPWKLSSRGRRASFLPEICKMAPA